MCVIASEGLYLCVAALIIYFSAMRFVAMRPCFHINSVNSDDVLNHVFTMIISQRLLAGGQNVDVIYIDFAKAFWQSGLPCDNEKAEGHGHICETGKMVTCLPDQPQTSSSC